jgi:hypothetical protein
MYAPAPPVVVSPPPSPHVNVYTPAPRHQPQKHVNIYTPVPKPQRHVNIYTPAPQRHVNIRPSLPQRHVNVHTIRTASKLTTLNRPSIVPRQNYRARRH